MLTWQSWTGVNVQIYFVLNLWNKKKKKPGSADGGTWPLPALEDGLGLCPLSLLSSGKELQLSCSASLGGNDKRCCSCWNQEQCLNHRLGGRPAQCPEQAACPLQMLRAIILVWYLRNTKEIQALEKTQSVINIHSKVHLFYLGMALWLKYNPGMTLQLQVQPAESSSTRQTFHWGATFILECLL